MGSAAPAGGNDWDRRGLPAWTYHSPALLKIEVEKLFLNHWQLAGHISDAPKPGDYFTFDLGRERALIARGADGTLRAFYNMCQHRGSRLVTGKSGHCRNAMVCPFHGWVYNLDGSLRGAARPETFGPMDKTQFALKPIEMEVWEGFVFLRFMPGPQPSVAKLLARISAEARHYRMDEVVPTRGFYEFRTPVNWKSVRDVDNEGYHVAMAHPALQDLYGHTYLDEPFLDGVSRSTGTYTCQGGRRWSVRNYLKIAPQQAWLPEDLRQRWTYFGLFPNCVIAVTPELIQFYQEFPLDVGNTLQRGAVYGRANESRSDRLARYLAQRIDRDTSQEDIQLTIWSNEAMASRAFGNFHLSDLEMGVRSHHDQIRRLLPVVNATEEPSHAPLAEINQQMAQSLLSTQP